MNILIVRGQKNYIDPDYCAVMRNADKNKIGVVFMNQNHQIVAKQKYTASQNMNKIVQNKNISSIFLDQRKNSELVPIPIFASSTNSLPIYDAAHLIMSMRMFIKNSELEELVDKTKCVVKDKVFRGHSHTENTRHHILHIKTNSGLHTKLSTSIPKTDIWTKIINAMHASANHVIEFTCPEQNISSLHDMYISSLSSSLSIPKDDLQHFVPFRVLHHTGFKPIEDRKTDVILNKDVMSINATFRSGTIGNIHIPKGYAEICRPIRVNKIAPATDLIGQDGLSHTLLQSEVN